MGFVNFLENMASKGRNSTLLSQLFQANEGFAKLAMMNLQRSLSERGIQLSDKILWDAKIDAAMSPKITIGQFIENNADKWG